MNSEEMTEVHIQNLNPGGSPESDSHKTATLWVRVKILGRSETV
jgi:hypothetical protein